MFRNLLIVTMLATAACQSQPSPETATANDTSMNNNISEPVANSLTGAESSEGWELLFDGKTKSGWHVFKNQTDGSAWSVKDGTLHLDPQEKHDHVTVGGGDLVSENEYENFHLQLEWKLDSGGNSGIMFYVKEDAKYERTWHTGPEMQVLDNAHHKDAQITKHRAGDLYDLITSSPETVKAAGEWNKVDIISSNGKLELHLNGTAVVTTTMWDENWRKLIAGSKFKDQPDFGTFRSGKIVLQDHGDKVWFKNIKIRKL